MDFGSMASCACSNARPGGSRSGQFAARGEVLDRKSVV